RRQTDLCAFVALGLRVEKLHGYFRYVVLACVAALLLSSCALGAAPAPDTPPAEATAPAAETVPPATDASAASNITITFGAISFMRKAYEPLIKTFNAQNPGITVQFVSLDEAYRIGDRFFVGRTDTAEQTRQIVSRADTAAAGANEEAFRLG